MENCSHWACCYLKQDLHHNNHLPWSRRLEGGDKEGGGKEGGGKEGGGGWRVGEKGEEPRGSLTRGVRQEHLAGV